MSLKLEDQRNNLIQSLRTQGIRDQAVLQALQKVPREDFVGIDLKEFAYDDTPLPIDEGQTISQPYIVALMTEALQLSASDKVLEVGCGSGYAAAVLSRITAEVYAIERHQSLAHQAQRRLQKLGYNNVEVMCGDGTLGWPEQAPFDAIIVAAGGPEAPKSLMEQLRVGGRLVIPVGPTTNNQRLLRITRVSKTQVEVEELAAVRFVPLIGEKGWKALDEAIKPKLVSEPVNHYDPTSELIEKAATHIPSIADVDLSELMARIGDSKVVLLGEASHGSAEFYDMRARISQALIEQKGFSFVAVEADWPDAAQIDHFVRGTRHEPTEEATFTRFPTWMWANSQVLEFAKWLRDHNAELTDTDSAVGFYGLDLYSLYASIDAVIAYLAEIDPKTADTARLRYGCLTPWQSDPATYGKAAWTGQHQGCETEVVNMLNDLLRKQLDYVTRDGRRFMNAAANARLIKNAEQYYRVMYRGSTESWNLRDTHMFETLKQLLDFHGPDAKAVVWEHNSHIGDARATDMGARGEINVGQLCRETFRDATYHIGFGTHHGTVAAATNWGGPMEIKAVRPSHPDSYERLFHNAGLNALMLPLGDKSQPVVEALLHPRLERAIGVIYRPDTELQSHYFNASLPHQFDEYIWFDETHAVNPLGPEAGLGAPDTFPFGL